MFKRNSLLNTLSVIFTESTFNLDFRIFDFKKKSYISGNFLENRMIKKLIPI